MQSQTDRHTGIGRDGRGEAKEWRRVQTSLGEGLRLDHTDKSRLPTVSKRTRLCVEEIRSQLISGEKTGSAQTQEGKVVEDVLEACAIIFNLIWGSFMASGGQCKND